MFKINSFDDANYKPEEERESSLKTQLHDEGCACGEEHLVCRDGTPEERGQIHQVVQEEGGRW